MDWIHLALDSDKLRVFVKVDGIPYNGGKFVRYLEEP